MRYTLLLDLDDTLLQNNIDRFLPHYLDAWGRFVAPWVEPQRFINALLAGTKAMSANRSPDCTLQEAFESVFFPRLGLPEAHFRQLAERFYAEVFPTLQPLTSPEPAGVPLVEEAQRRGYPVAIATNPLFPLTAIQQRLAWAELPVERYSFDLVASYETFHFVKPDPAYFAEVLARLGWPDGPAVIAGDDVEREVAAGRKLGLPVYWLEQPGVTVPSEVDGPSARGRLDGLLPWLDRAQPESLLPDFSAPNALLAILRSTLAALDTFCRSLDPRLWIERPKADEWSLTEVLCHLRDVETDVNLARVQKVLAETNPFLPGEDTDAWAAERNYAHQDGRRALVEFTAARLRLVELLEALDASGWQRPARHAIFGPTRLVELVGILAAHDRLHVRQVKTLVDGLA